MERPQRAEDLRLRFHSDAEAHASCARVLRLLWNVASIRPRLRHYWN